MGEFLSYSIISGLLLLALYLTYRLLLAKDNQHAFNRFILLLIYFVSFAAAPLFTLTERSVSYSHAQTAALEGIAEVSTTAMQQPVWGTVLIWVFMSGASIVTVKTIITWIRLTNVIRTGEKHDREGYTLVVTDDRRFAPFSWMRYIVVSRDDFENGCRAITAHEQKHVACRHWIDLLIAQGVCIINWFNPAAWLMRDELMLVHEYQADMAVIDSGHDTQEYQMLLIKKAVGARFPSLANSLNHSKLKKRITMMYKEKSGAGRKIKALALVPMLALSLGIAEIPAVRAAVSTIGSSALSVDKDNENLSQGKTTVRSFKVTNINNSGIETTVVIIGNGLGNNLTVSGGTFTNNGKTFRAKSLRCEMTDGTAKIIATFPFSEEMKKPKMTLMVNGDEIPFNLEKFHKNAQSVVVGAKPKSTGISSEIIINGKSTSVPGNMKYILDGKEISEAELKEISPENIASVTVDKQNNTLRITTKK